ncbi:hypothetical protein BDZ97DRAFT_1917494 [Flammula alnicola]|nr:hypothetical protein BDZ97DRAFT_1917494 [Flammula alnicola]
MLHSVGQLPKGVVSLVDVHSLLAGSPDPPAPVTHLPVDPSPAPSISTRSRSQLKTAPRAQATLPFKASTAPAAASSSSRTRTTSTRATSPVTRAAPVASKSRKASSVIEPQDSDGEQVDELDDEPEPTPKPSKASQVDFHMHERLQNPGRCLACTTLLLRVNLTSASFLVGDGAADLARAVVRLAAHLSFTPRSSTRCSSRFRRSSPPHASSFVSSFSRLTGSSRMRPSNRACSIPPKGFPPGHVVGPRFEDMDILDTLLSGDHSLLDDYLDKSATQKLPTPRSGHTTLPPSVASTSQQAPSRSAASSEDAATQPSAADLFNEDVPSDTRDPQELGDSREADELDELDDAPMQTDN